MPRRLSTRRTSSAGTGSPVTLRQGEWDASIQKVLLAVVGPMRQSAATMLHPSTRTFWDLSYTQAASIKRIFSFGQAP